MPELPEVETTRRGVDPHVVGRKIVALAVHEPRLRWRVPDTLSAAVKGQLVRQTGRRAKYILFELESGTLLLHLGMSGSLRVLPADTPRIGSLHYTTDRPEEHFLLAKLAPEPLDDAFDADYLWRITRKRKVAIKQLLMNSSLVVGVGNIYASEALFRARIRPKRQARSLKPEEVKRLTKSVKDVLKMAIKVGGTTLRDYVNADGYPGYFRQKLYVYERSGKPCRVCKGPVKHFTQGQRSTYY